MIDVSAALGKHDRYILVDDPIAAVLSHWPRDYITVKMPSLEIAHPDYPAHEQRRFG